MPAGAPAIPFDQEVADEICERLATSTMGLEDVLESMARDGIATPGLSTIYKWKRIHPEFAKSSARAMEDRADTIVDRAILEASSSRIGEIRTERTEGENTTVDVKIADNVERSKLIVQTLLKRAGQLSPKKYSDRLDVNVGVQTDKLDEFRAAFAAGPVPFGQTNAGVVDESEDESGR